MHKKTLKTQPVHKPTTVRVQEKKISHSQHTAQTVLTCPHVTTATRIFLLTVRYDTVRDDSLTGAEKLATRVSLIYRTETDNEKV